MQSNNPQQAFGAPTQQTLDAGQAIQCQKTRKWLSNYYMPYVCVFSSPTTQAKLQDLNNLTPAEFLRPFGEVGNLNNYSVQTCEKNMPYKLKNFKIQFIDSQRMFNDPKQSARIVEKIIKTQKPKLSSKSLNPSHNQKMNKKQVEDSLLNLIGPTRGSTERMNTPWFTQWKKQFYQSVRFPLHELTQQPVAFVYFISVDDKDPLGAIDTLRRLEHQPSQYRAGVYENLHTNIKTFVFILNDNKDEIRYADTYSAVRGQFATNIVHEIKMSGSADVQDDIWKDYAELDHRQFEDSSQKPKRGCQFSQNDRSYAQSTVRKCIEKTLLPFMIQKIKNLEQSVANTRKGLKNKLSRMFKSSERSENDGIKENFKMNKSDLELRNLVDLSFVIQDFETACTNAEYPSSDFKRIKAYKYAASCEELRMLSRIAFDKFYAAYSFKEIVQTANQIYDYYSKSTNSSHCLIKFSLQMTELFQVLGKHQEAADFMVRIATILSHTAVMKPLIFEQAAYEYLYMRKYRKFAFYMSLAAQFYEKIQLTFYSFNCYTIVHPYYQCYKNWNAIQFKLYSSLGDNCQKAQENPELAVQFFRNLLELSHKFTDVTQQRQCLNQCLIAFGKFTAGRGSQEKGEIGQIGLPEVLPHTVEVFTDSEKLYTNKPSKLIDNKFLPDIYQNEVSNEPLRRDNEYVVQKKSEFNTQNIAWKFMEQKVTSYIKNQHKDTQQEAIYTVSLDEQAECAIYDASSQQEKNELTQKRVRKVFQNVPITVRFIMRNPLRSEISVSKIQLQCQYIQDKSAEVDMTPTDGVTEDFEVDTKDLKFTGLQEQEVLLKVLPKRTGEIMIKKIKWELLDLFKCDFPLMIEEGEKTQLPRQLVSKAKTFQYKVLPESAELQLSIQLTRNSTLGQSLIFTEVDRGYFLLKNLSTTRSVSNMFLLCSHPLVFGFKHIPILKDAEDLSSGFQVLAPGEEIKVPLVFRASLPGLFVAKFLVRYELQPLRDEEKIQSQCQYRFQRLMLFLNSKSLFRLQPQVHLSTKKSDEFLVNLQTIQEIQTSKYEKPKITSIEIVKGYEQWTLAKKNDTGNFFIVNPKREDSQVQQRKEDVLEGLGADASPIDYSQPEILVFAEGQQASDVSVKQDSSLFSYYDKESEYSVTKLGTKETITNEAVDLVVRWEMPSLFKQGFYSLLRVELLKLQRHLTNQQQKNMLAQQGKDNVEANSKAPSKVKRLNPIHVTYQFDTLVSHDFSSKPNVIVPLTLNVQNLLQTDDTEFVCEIQALQNWNSAVANSRFKSCDVSEGESFLWVGKTNIHLKNMQPNETRQVQLKASMSRPGLYNLNRFQLNIKQLDSKGNVVQVGDSKAKNSFFLPEFKLNVIMMVKVEDNSEGTPAEAPLIEL